MQGVIDELLIGIANETLSLLILEVNPDSSKVYACLCAYVGVYVERSDWKQIMMRPA